MRLTTRGRKSGEPRTVTIWFVVADDRRVLVQHVARAPAHWYRNLAKEPACQVDFGEGPLEARARPIQDAAKIQDVLHRIRDKYWTARLIQWIGRSSNPVAAEIEIVAT